MRASLREMDVAKGDGARVRPAARKRAAVKRARSERQRGAYRLTADVRPIEADLHIVVDPAQSDAFSGDVLHHLELTRGRRILELHAVGLTVTKAHAEVGDKIVRGRVQLRAERETVEIVLAEPLPAGLVTLVLEFKGKLATDLRGLYAARSAERNVRVHAARGGRRAPLLPVLRRARDEGALPASP